MKTIVLCGGPSSGKTTVINHIKENGLDIGFDRVICISEIAERILNRNPLIRQNQWEFQTTIYYCQLEVENAYHSLLQETNTLLIIDRGLADLAVYLSDKATMFMDNNKTSLTEIFSRYDAVYLLETVHSSQYKKTNIRTESCSESEMLNNSTIKIWSQHPRCYFVKTTKQPKDKVIETIKMIKETSKDWA